MPRLATRYKHGQLDAKMSAINGQTNTVNEKQAETIDQQGELTVNAN
jgi:hypothetical protein